MSVRVSRFKSSPANAEARTVALIEQAHALEDEVRGRISAEAIERAVIDDRVEIYGKKTRHRGMLKLRAAANEAKDAKAIAILKAADSNYWEAGLIWDVWGCRRALGLVAGVDPEDVKQWARIGLFRAATLFEPHHKVKFRTYAAWWIRAVLVREVIIRGSAVKISASSRYLPLVMGLERYLRKDPDLTREELADRLGITLQELERARMLLAARGGGISLDAPVGDGDGELRQMDLIEGPVDDPGDAMDARTLVARIQTALRVLPVRDRKIVERRTGLLNGQNENLRVIGADHNLSRERIRQIERRSYEQIAACGFPDISELLKERAGTKVERPRLAGEVESGRCTWPSCRRSTRMRFCARHEQMLVRIGAEDLLQGPIVDPHRLGFVAEWCRKGRGGGKRGKKVPSESCPKENPGSAPIPPETTPEKLGLSSAQTSKKHGPKKAPEKCLEPEKVDGLCACGWWRVNGVCSNATPGGCPGFDLPTLAPEEGDTIWCTCGWPLEGDRCRNPFEGVCPCASPESGATSVRPTDPPSVRQRIATLLLQRLG